ncbi:DUF3341 domain-containing protein [Lutibacter sp.]|uniref:DUF3341 domain-containing protein n=1 Tax=Lutibacter sp. TaxID=1925666 RepID=UPI002734480E|nr:DUF3341 domain-containing protein [Lutibacter sp.]MDP3312056.1 DUF3341 domain-containing protein [Lutibacter sp.]
MTNKVIQAMYNDDDVLMHAVKEVRAANHHIAEIYTPFPVHGLDKAMGLKETRIAITSFLYGCVGFSFAIWMMNYMMIEQWPQDIGGKPSFSFFLNVPAFVPVIFEMTVFFAAHLMVITFYMRSKLWPFKEAENPDPRTTDDMFVMEVSVDGNEDELVAFLEKTGTVEIKVTEKH